jgi:hypothetical protein
MLEINWKEASLADILPIVFTYGIHYSLIIGAFPVKVHLKFIFVAHSLIPNATIASRQKRGPSTKTSVVISVTVLNFFSCVLM